LDRYDTMLALQSRGEFDRVRAGRYVSGDLDERDRWVAVNDAKGGGVWVPAGEFATYLRLVYGERISHNAVDARIAEAGGTRVRFEDNRRHKGGKHVSLI